MVSLSLPLPTPAACTDNLSPVSGTTRPDTDRSGSGSDTFAGRLQQAVRQTRPDSQSGRAATRRASRVATSASPAAEAPTDTTRTDTADTQETGSADAVAPTKPEAALTDPDALQASPAVTPTGQESSVATQTGQTITPQAVPIAPFVPSALLTATIATPTPAPVVNTPIVVTAPTVVTTSTAAPVAVPQTVPAVPTVATAQSNTAPASQVPPAPQPAPFVAPTPALATAPTPITNATNPTPDTSRAPMDSPVTASPVTPRIAAAPLNNVSVAFADTVGNAAVAPSPANPPAVSNASGNPAGNGLEVVAPVSSIPAGAAPITAATGAAEPATNQTAKPASLPVVPLVPHPAAPLPTAQSVAGDAPDITSQAVPLAKAGVPDGEPATKFEADQPLSASPTGRSQVGSLERLLTLGAANKLASATPTAPVLPASPRPPASSVLTLPPVSPTPGAAATVPAGVGNADYAGNAAISVSPFALPLTLAPTASDSVLSAFSTTTEAALSPFAAVSGLLAAQPHAATAASHSKGSDLPGVETGSDGSIRSSAIVPETQGAQAQTGGERDADARPDRQNAPTAPAELPGTNTAFAASVRDSSSNTVPATGPLAVSGKLDTAAADRAHLMEQVTKHIETLKAEHLKGEITLRLSPEHLGSVKLTIVRQGDGVAARLVTENAQAQQAMQNGREHLRAALEQKGLNLQSLDVSVSTQSGSNPGDLTNAQQRHFDRAETVRTGVTSGPRTGGLPFSTDAPAPLSAPMPARLDPNTRLDYQA